MFFIVNYFRPTKTKKIVIPLKVVSSYFINCVLNNGRRKRDRSASGPVSELMGMAILLLGRDPEALAEQLFFRGHHSVEILPKEILVSQPSESLLRCYPLVGDSSQINILPHRPALVPHCCPSFGFAKCWQATPCHLLILMLVLIL